MQNTTIFDQPSSRGQDEVQTPTYEQNATRTPNQEYGGDYRGETSFEPGGGGMQREGENMFGNEMASNLASGLVMNAGLGTAAALGLGAPFGSALSSGVGGAISGVFGPMSLLNMADNAYGTHQAIEESKEYAGMFPGEEQQNVMQGVFNSQPHSWTGRQLANMGLGDPGLQGEEMSQLAMNVEGVDPALQEEMQMSMMSPEELDQQSTNLELQQNIMEYNQPGMLESALTSMGLKPGAPDEAAISAAGPELTQSGAFDSQDPNSPNFNGGFSPVNNVSDQYESTGTGPMGEQTFGDISQPSSPDTGAIATDQPAGVEQTAPEVVGTPSSVVADTSQGIQDAIVAGPSIEEQRAADARAAQVASDQRAAKAAAEEEQRAADARAAQVASDQRAAKAAADAAAQQQHIAGLKSAYSAAAVKFNSMSEKVRDSRGGSARRKMNATKAELEAATGKTYSVTGNQWTGYNVIERVDNRGGSSYGIGGRGGGAWSNYGGMGGTEDRGGDYGFGGNYGGGGFRGGSQGTGMNDDEDRGGMWG